MKAYIVMVRPGSPDRYMDSIWISKTNADNRAVALAGEFTRKGKAGSVKDNLIEGWGAWVSEVDIEDGVLVNPKEPKK